MNYSYIRSAPVEITHSGKVVLRYYQQLKVLEHEFINELKNKSKYDRLLIKIGVNADSLETWFLPVLDQLLNESNYLLELVPQDQSLTHKMLKNGEVMASISEESKAISGCTAKYIGELNYVCVCTPDFYRKHFSDVWDNKEKILILHSLKLYKIYQLFFITVMMACINSIFSRCLIQKHMLKNLLIISNLILFPLLMPICILSNKAMDMASYLSSNTWRLIDR